MSGNDDLKFMKRCLELASKAEGMTYPNPLVGSVIVHRGMIIGEGYHLKAGSPHAEANAIASVRNKELLMSSTLYVNLEPCSHFGKTPPCADLIISYGIPRVVTGTIDSSKRVSGTGILKLREAGIEVVTGIAEDESRWINRRFFTFHEKGRPYIILKWAQSADGYIDTVRTQQSSPEPNWITGKPERILVHKWRASEQAILVGAGTVRADNPKLNVREWKGEDPLRLILSMSGKIPTDSEVFKREGTNIIFTNFPHDNTMDGTKFIKLDPDIIPAAQISDYLYKLGIQSLIIEGGAMTLEHFILSGYWDEARIFTGLKNFNNGIRAPGIKGKLRSKTNFRESKLEILVKADS